MRRTLRRVGPCRMADGRGGGAAGVRPAARAGVRRDARWAGVRAGRAGGPGISRSGSSVFEAAGERDNGAERSGLLESVARLMQVSSLSAIVLVGALCFVLGASSAPPRSMLMLWQEYKFGVNGRKAAEQFTVAERNSKPNKQKYYRRNMIWKTIARLVRGGLTPEVAIDRIHRAYGYSTTPTKITNLT